jgi:di/tricarboxylate transporter
VIAALFAMSGLAAGLIQSGLVARSARRAPHPAAFAARYLLVGAVLVTAALAGQLVICAAGWLAGFAGGAAVVYRRLR